MKELTEALIVRFTNGDASECQVLIAVSQHLQTVGLDDGVLLPAAAILNLSGNELKEESLQKIWSNFPQAWWVDLSNNSFSSLNAALPVALGSLNLRGNNIQADQCSLLSLCQIVRLSLSLSSQSTAAYHADWLRYSHLLPNVWVLNDDYISPSSKSPLQLAALKNSSVASATASVSVMAPENALLDDSLVLLACSPKQRQKQGNWKRSLQANPRELAMLLAIQSLPTHSKVREHFRLDVLLEEYLHEATIFNSFASGLALSNNTSIRTLKLMPIVNVFKLLHLPHAARLDTSVVLTALLHFHVPEPVCRDALALLCNKWLSLAEITDIIRLPVFAKTALVSIIRRSVSKEQTELYSNNCIAPKPPIEEIPLATVLAGEPASYLNSSGFVFLKQFRLYMEVPVTDLSKGANLAGNGNADASHQAFSDLELDIIKSLPDIPTAFDIRVFLLSKAEKEAAAQAARSDNKANARLVHTTVPLNHWVEFAARHTVLLLAKSPLCPPLTKRQTSQMHQTYYNALMPLLAAGSMALQDLNISLTGALQDGRVGRVAKPVHRAGRALRAQQQQGEDLAAATSTSQEPVRFLEYGDGLPNASVASLTWNAAAGATNMGATTGSMNDCMNGDTDGELDTGLLGGAGMGSVSTGSSFVTQSAADSLGASYRAKQGRVSGPTTRNIDSPPPPGATSFKRYTGAPYDANSDSAETAASGGVDPRMEDTTTFSQALLTTPMDADVYTTAEYQHSRQRISSDGKLSRAEEHLLNQRRHTESLMRPASVRDCTVSIPVGGNNFPHVLTTGAGEIPEEIVRKRREQDMVDSASVTGDLDALTGIITSADSGVLMGAHTSTEAIMDGDHLPHGSFRSGYEPQFEQYEQSPPFPTLATAGRNEDRGEIVSYSSGTRGSGAVAPTRRQPVASDESVSVVSVASLCSSRGGGPLSQQTQSQQRSGSQELKHAQMATMGGSHNNSLVLSTSADNSVYGAASLTLSLPSARPWSKSPAYTQSHASPSSRGFGTAQQQHAMGLDRHGNGPSLSPGPDGEEAATVVTYADDMSLGSAGLMSVDSGQVGGADVEQEPGYEPLGEGERRKRFMRPSSSKSLTSPQGGQKQEGAVMVAAPLSPARHSDCHSDSGAKEQEAREILQADWQEQEQDRNFGGESVGNSTLYSQSSSPLHAQQPPLPLSHAVSSSLSPLAMNSPSHLPAKARASSPMHENGHAQGGVHAHQPVHSKGQHAGAAADGATRMRNDRCMATAAAPVLGFSADGKCKSAFVLAPPRAIAKLNMHIASVANGDAAAILPPLAEEAPAGRHPPAVATTIHADDTSTMASRLSFGTGTGEAALPQAAAGGIGIHGKRGPAFPSLHPAARSPSPTLNSIPMPGVGLLSTWDNIEHAPVLLTGSYAAVSKRIYITDPLSGCGSSGTTPSAVECPPSNTAPYVGQPPPLDVHASNVDIDTKNADKPASQPSLPTVAETDVAKSPIVAIDKVDNDRRVDVGLADPTDQAGTDEAAGGRTKNTSSLHRMRFNSLIATFLGEVCTVPDANPWAQAARDATKAAEQALTAYEDTLLTSAAATATAITATNGADADVDSAACLPAGGMEMIGPTGLADLTGLGDLGGLHTLRSQEESRARPLQRLQAALGIGAGKINSGAGARAGTQDIVNTANSEMAKLTLAAKKAREDLLGKPQKTRVAMHTDTNAHIAPEMAIDTTTGLTGDAPTVVETSPLSLNMPCQKLSAVGEDMLTAAMIAASVVGGALEADLRGTGTVHSNSIAASDVASVLREAAADTPTATVADAQPTALSDLALARRREEERTSGGEMEGSNALATGLQAELDRSNARLHLIYENFIVDADSAATIEEAQHHHHQQQQMKEQEQGLTSTSEAGHRHAPQRQRRRSSYVSAALAGAAAASAALAGDTAGAAQALQVLDTALLEVHASKLFLQAQQQSQKLAIEPEEYTSCTTSHSIPLPLANQAAATYKQQVDAAAQALMFELGTVRNVRELRRNTLRTARDLKAFENEVRRKQLEHDIELQGVLSDTVMEGGESIISHSQPFAMLDTTRAIVDGSSPVEHKDETVKSLPNRHSPAKSMPTAVNAEKDDDATVFLTGMSLEEDSVGAEPPASSNPVHPDTAVRTNVDTDIYAADARLQLLLLSAAGTSVFTTRKNLGGGQTGKSALKQGETMQSQVRSIDVGTNATYSEQSQQQLLQATAHKQSLAVIRRLDPVHTLTHNTLSTVELVKLRSNYGKVFLNHEQIEFAGRTASGLQLPHSQHWFPHLRNKNVYRISLQCLPELPLGGGRAEAMTSINAPAAGNITGPSTIDPVDSVLADDTVLGGDKSSQSRATAQNEVNGLFAPDPIAADAAADDDAAAVTTTANADAVSADANVAAVLESDAALKRNVSERRPSLSSAGEESSLLPPISSTSAPQGLPPVIQLDPQQQQRQQQSQGIRGMCRPVVPGKGVWTEDILSRSFSATDPAFHLSSSPKRSSNMGTKSGTGIGNDRNIMAHNKRLMSRSFSGPSMPTVAPAGGAGNSVRMSMSVVPNSLFTNSMLGETESYVNPAEDDANYLDHLALRRQKEDLQTQEQQEKGREKAMTTEMHTNTQIFYGDSIATESTSMPSEGSERGTSTTYLNNAPHDKDGETALAENDTSTVKLMRTDHYFQSLLSGKSSNSTLGPTGAGTGFPPLRAARPSLTSADQRTLLLRTLPSPQFQANTQMHGRRTPQQKMSIRTAGSSFATGGCKLPSPAGQSKPAPALRSPRGAATKAGKLPPKPTAAQYRAGSAAVVAVAAGAGTAVTKGELGDQSIATVEGYGGAPLVVAHGGFPSNEGNPSSADGATGGLNRPVESSTSASFSGQSCMAEKWDWGERLNAPESTTTQDREEAVVERLRMNPHVSTPKSLQINVSLRTPQQERVGSPGALVGTDIVTDTNPQGGLYGNSEKPSDSESPGARHSLLLSPASGHALQPAGAVIPAVVNAPMRKVGNQRLLSPTGHRGSGKDDDKRGVTSLGGRVISSGGPPMALSAHILNMSMAPSGSTTTGNRAALTRAVPPSLSLHSPAKGESQLPGQQPADDDQSVCTIESAVESLAIYNEYDKHLRGEPERDRMSSRQECATSPQPVHGNTKHAHSRLYPHSSVSKAEEQGGWGSGQSREKVGLQQQHKKQQHLHPAKTPVAHGDDQLHHTFRFSGQIQSPWVGKERYRAATHKLALNTAFTVTIDRATMAATRTGAGFASTNSAVNDRALASSSAAPAPPRVSRAVPLSHQ